jgi:hypothetical protein
LYYHVTRTRQLLGAWDQVGKYLNRPARPINRPAEATDLIRHMHAIRDLLKTFPPLLGAAGQPGYLVVSLARQQAIVPTLQTMQAEPRENLARHWQAGRTVLMEHRQHLLQELRALRRRGVFSQATRAVKDILRGGPEILLLVVAFVALDLWLVDTFDLRKWKFEYGLLAVEVVGLLALIAVRVLWWWSGLRLTRPHKPPPTPGSPLPVRPRPRRQPNSSGA